jgi:hypothetical protein
MKTLSDSDIIPVVTRGHEFFYTFVIGYSLDWGKLGIIINENCNGLVYYQTKRQIYNKLTYFREEITGNIRVSFY